MSKPPSLLSWFLLAIPAGLLLILGVWYFLPGKRRRLLPPEEGPGAPWGPTEIVLAFFLIFVTFFLGSGWLHLSVRQVLLATGFLGRQTGVPPEYLAVLAGAPDAAFPANLPWGALAQTTETGSAQAMRHELWCRALTFPILMVLVVPLLVLVKLSDGPRPEQFGLSARYLGRNLFAGLAGWITFTPFVYAVQFLAVQLHQQWAQGPLESHPLTRLAEHQPSLMEWGLILFTALVAAPLWEELFFRGFLQRTLAQRPWGGATLLWGTVCWALLVQRERIEASWREQGAWGVLAPSGPVSFVLAAVVGFLLLRRFRPSPAAEAVYATALFFAVGHPTWPHPIPLFVLGLGLGLVAQRTGSLVGPMAMHILFNGVACTMLLATHLSPAPPSEKGSDATSAVRAPAGVSISTGVPGSWWPRRTYASAITPSRGETTDDAACPTSLPSRSSRAPDGNDSVPATRRPVKVRFTWPRSRMRTIGS